MLNKEVASLEKKFLYIVGIILSHTKGPCETVYTLFYLLEYSHLI